ncbi:MAG: transcription antitermination factor NusB [Flavobacteriaceae bacterium]|nr:transcription antitermination factor NusB [Flavobacteriaceae bacterium]
MINRRHIRIKVMQSVYAFFQSKNQDLSAEEKFLNTNINKLQELFVLMLSLLVELKKESQRVIDISRKKHLATSDDLNPNKKFINNKVFLSIESSPSYLTYTKNHNLDLWTLNNKFIKNLWAAVKQSSLYEKYMTSEESTIKEDIVFVSAIYTDIIATDEKLYDFLGDVNIGWMDDFPFVNTLILKSLRKIKSIEPLKIENLYKDDADAKFAIELFRKVVLNHLEFTQVVDEKTPNWDSERIAELDLILIKMALTEFIYFPSIPTKVSINEYLEIAKDYSTKQSSVFINGVLDKLLKEYQSQNKINKVGRGLL